jgi:hypothetical protein
MLQADRSCKLLTGILLFFFLLLISSLFSQIELSCGSDSLHAGFTHPKNKIRWEQFWEHPKNKKCLEFPEMAGIFIRIFFKLWGGEFALQTHVPIVSSAHRQLTCCFQHHM